MNFHLPQLRSLKPTPAIQLIILALVVALTLTLLYLTRLWAPRLEAQQHKSLVKVDLYIDPTDYFQYYYSFKYFTQVLQIDGLSSHIQSLNRLDLNLNMDKYTSFSTPKIYVIVVYERNLEKYQETLELLAARNNLVLWIMTPHNVKFNPPPSFTLDATTSASNSSALKTDFRRQILPRILTIYTSLL